MTELVMPGILYVAQLEEGYKLHRMGFHGAWIVEHMDVGPVELSKD